MAKRFYTVLVLPDATSPARVFHISQPVLAALSLVAAFGIFAFAFFLDQYVTLHARMLELKQSRQEVGERQVMAERVNHLEGELSKLRDLDRRLRVAVGLDKSAAQPASLGQGGADTKSRTALLDALKQRTGHFLDSMNQDLAALQQEVHSREQSFRELKTYLDQKAAFLASIPTILPIQGLITSGYGYRKSPFTGLRDFHEGLDIAAPFGTPIHATADGLVSFVGPLAAFGNVVFVDHGHGFSTIYAHNSQARVREGQQVRRGDIIAYVGASGRTTGPHVHYGIYVKGSLSNPLKFVVDTAGLRFIGETEAGSSS